MNTFSSAIDLATIGNWRPEAEDYARDVKFLLIETQCLIENLLVQEPGNVDLRLLNLFLTSNMRKLELAEMEKKS